MAHSASKYQLILLCFMLTLFPAGSASAEIRNGTIGEVIPFSGTAPGFDLIYVFMTGPGVPSEGSRMDSSISPVVTGDPNTFTQVPVLPDGWSYTWQTGRVSGGLAPGLFTIYAATAPAAADSLSGIPYSTTEIFLSRPATTGTILARSVPPGAQVEVNGRYSGNTPSDLPDLPPGEYRINISLTGYAPATGLYHLSAGEMKEVSVELVPLSPSTTPSALAGTVIPVSRESTLPASPTRAPIPLIIIIVGVCTWLAVTQGFLRR